MGTSFYCTSNCTRVAAKVTAVLSTQLGCVSNASCSVMLAF
jgi:hypothetical protein